jgi:dTDP-4-dehydrorhamnose reductase
VTAQIVARGPSDLAALFASAGHAVNVAAGGETSWHAFALAIVDGLARRGVAVKARSVIPIGTGEYPVKATRPKNSRLDLSRLRERFQIEPAEWAALLDAELDRLVALTRTSGSRRNS